MTNELEKSLEVNEGMIAVADNISRKNKVENIEDMITNLDVIGDKIYDLKQTISDDLIDLECQSKELKGRLDLEIARQADGVLGIQDYGCGTHNFDTSRHKIKVTVSKKVKWDETMLQSIANQISEAGKDPKDFIKFKLSVAEKMYASFPADIADIFEPAREVSAGAPKITIERK